MRDRVGDRVNKNPWQGSETGREREGERESNVVIYFIQNAK